MLKKRLMTGLILGFLTILAIVFAPFSVFVIASALLILFAAWEWSLLTGLKKRLTRLLYVISTLLFMGFAWYIPVQIVLWTACLWWFFTIFLIVTYPKTSHWWAKDTWKRASIGWLVLIPAWLALVTVRTEGLSILMLMLLLVWSADTGAYFAGRACGKHLLLPSVSPKKTVEGAIGGLLLSLLVASVWCLILRVPFASWFMIMGLSIMTVLFSVVGDLLESMLKRQIGIKDIGNYLPGHGGLLDRIDSITAAAPIFILVYRIIF